MFSAHIAELVQFFLGIGGNVNISEDIRTQAISFLMWTILFKKSKVMRLKLVEPMVQALMNIGSEEEPEDMDEDHPARVCLS